MIARNVHPKEGLAAETGTALAVDPPSAGLRDAAPMMPPPRQSAHDRHFSTEHLTSDLKGRSVRGGAVTLAAQGVKFALQLVQTVVLARLLAPEAFGLVAMVTAVTGFVAMFKDAGLSMATVQREHITHEQISTLFWINVALSAVLAVLVAALAPTLAWLYGDPRLTAITLVLAGTFVLSGLAIQHQALLRRQMRFTALATIQIITMATGVTAAITAAVLGASYWALVAMAIVQSVVGTGLVWGMCRWMPGLPVRGSGVRGMLAFGGYLTGSQMLAYLRRNLDNILIGAMWGAGSLGIYSKAYQLLLLPITQINGPVSNVVVPALSRLQNDPLKYRRYYSHALMAMTALGLPVITFASLVPSEIIYIVLGPQWNNAVSIFLALLPAAFMGTLNVAGGWIFISSGRTDKQFRANIVMTVITAGAFLGGSPWGPVGIAIAFSASFTAYMPFVFSYAFSETPIGWSDLLKALWRPAANALIAALTTACIKAFFTPQLRDIVTLLALSVLFTSVYLAGWMCTSVGRRSALSLIRSTRHTARKRFATSPAI